MNGKKFINLANEALSLNSVLVIGSSAIGEDSVKEFEQSESILNVKKNKSLICAVKSVIDSYLKK